MRWSSPPGPDVPRFNPFTLALYSDWVQDDPALDAETVTAGDLDPYVEMRIIRRLKLPALRDLMPAVVLLRRFNREMLEPALDAAELTATEAYRFLANQEWTSYQPGAAAANTFLEISPGLYQRLLDYYERPTQQARLEAARARLVPWLVETVRNRRLSELDLPQLDATLRLLDDARAAIME